MSHRIKQCAQYMRDELSMAPDLDGDLLEQLVTESALAAGYTEPEIAAAWAVVDNQEGA